MNARLLDMLHDAADEHALPVAHAIDVDFGGQVQEAIEQNGAGVRHADGRIHIGGEVFFAMDHLHCPPAQDI